jgi:hypothetical protein
VLLNVDVHLIGFASQISLDCQSPLPYDVAPRTQQNGQMDGWKGLKNDTKSRSTSNMEKLALLQLTALIILHKWRQYDSSVKSMNSAISLIWTKLA